MKRNVILVAVVCLLAVAFAGMVAAQDANKMIQGNWTATIHAPDKTMTESWMIKQDSTGKIVGTAKGDKGELPLSGTMAGNVFRGLVTDGDQHYQVHLTLDGDDMDGTIRMGKNEYLLMLKKAK
jgi:hypothetical protein